MLALAFCEVIMPEDMLDSFHNTKGKISQLGFPICLQELLIYWRKCLCLIPVIASLVWRKSSNFTFNIFYQWIVAQVLFVFYLHSKIVMLVHGLQLMRPFVTNICHLSMISMMSLSAPGLFILILSTHHVLKSTSKSSSGGNQWSSIRIYPVRRKGLCCRKMLGNGIASSSECPPFIIFSRIRTPHS